MCDTVTVQVLAGPRATPAQWFAVIANPAEEELSERLTARRPLEKLQKAFLIVTIVDESAVNTIGPPGLDVGLAVSKGGNENAVADGAPASRPPAAASIATAPAKSSRRPPPITRLTGSIPFASFLIAAGAMVAVVAGAVKYAAIDLDTLVASAIRT